MLERIRMPVMRSSSVSVSVNPGAAGDPSMISETEVLVRTIMTAPHNRTMVEINILGPIFRMIAVAGI